MQPGGADDAGRDDAGRDVAANPLLIAAIASLGAAALHAAASGAHSDAITLARIFVVTALAQGAAAVLGLLRPSAFAAAVLAVVNGAAAGGWLLTRLTGLSDVPGLEVAESPGLADTAAAVLAVAAALAAVLASVERTSGDHGRGVATASVIVAALVVPGMLDVTGHEHTHTEDAAGAEHTHTDAGTAAAGAVTPAAAVADQHSDGHDHAPATTPVSIPANSGAPAATEAPHEHAADTEPDAEAGHSHAADAAVTDAAGSVVWPRPWNPAEPIDFSGVPGVSDEQQARAEALVADTLRDLPQFADVNSSNALGYRSIGDAGTGFEHYINLGMLGDDSVLDPNAPESLVFSVGDIADPHDRTLVSAMYISQATSLDDPAIAGFAGPLMQWHNHTNLCWGRDAADNFVVKGVTDAAGQCPAGTVNTGGQFPMVHVWIAPHECGPFAALEGHGAGQAGEVSNGERVDLCADHHDGGHAGTDGSPAAAQVPYDPARPIDLSGTPGVAPEQQAFAENLIADTVRNLPQWSDPAVAEAAGFHSIQDGSTGHEHYIQWDWINDDVWLDPDRPESLVYEPQADGSKRLVSAMYMLPDDTPLDEVPDWGGALMQWHVHGDLCFTDDPVAPRVGGTRAVGDPCVAPLVDRGTAPMIHVWITPNECGPFAALEGIGAGQVQQGEQHRCDAAHGSH